MGIFTENLMNINAAKSANRAQVSATNAENQRIAEDIRILENQNVVNKQAMSREYAQSYGASLAASGSNGSVLGSALDVMLGNETLNSLDVLNMDYDTKLQRRLLETQGSANVAASRAQSKSSQRVIYGEVIKGVEKAVTLGLAGMSGGAGGAGGASNSFNGISGSRPAPKSGF